jgi:predicted Rossmann-fold nucleotide-binding protein
VTADFVLAGTGSRSLRTAPREVQVAAMDLCMERVAQRIVEHGSRLVVMSGGAEGLDELLARVAIRLGVRLHLVLPSKSYASHYWGRKSVLGRDRLAEFAEIVAAAWKTTCVAEQILHTTSLYVDGLHINFHRNLIMTEWADDFVVWDPSSRGTSHCVSTIRAAGKWRDDMVLGPDPLSDQTALPMGTVSAS